jgi:hypothetical protein
MTKVILSWAVGNLCWMLLVYGLTLAYYRFRRRPARSVFNALGTLLATTAGVAAAAWARNTTTVPAGTPVYYVGLTYVAFGGAAVVGILLIVCADHLTGRSSTNTNHWLGQLLMPFYVSMAIWLLLSLPFVVVASRWKP